jgi:hypothetical protein
MKMPARGANASPFSFLQRQYKMLLSARFVWHAAGVFVVGIDSTRDRLWPC